MTRTASENTAGDRLGELARTIRKQAAAPSTRRHLRGLPGFEVVKDVPEHLQALLDELKDAEGKANV
ncbi:hypothetical protein ASD50_00435 [Mesorhizobium sp. Root552]|uniref:hypothetical protein n=1 Tax=Mesorhizobium sp. Root552 TaxID=1736555 RepID=UPI0006F5CE00|nr:hypothetical protein [Mesorhizobium sp. Root552]KQZ33302.1 hypothetical protein ASD50_00435 [Mesorhizobium sp. Root552]